MWIIYMLTDLLLLFVNCFDGANMCSPYFQYFSLSLWILQVLLTLISNVLIFLILLYLAQFLLISLFKCLNRPPSPLLSSCFHNYIQHPTMVSKQSLTTIRCTITFSSHLPVTLYLTDTSFKMAIYLT